MSIITSRRSFLIGGLALVAAPAIIRVESLMPVKPMVSDYPTVLSISINQRASYRWVWAGGCELIDGTRRIMDLYIPPSGDSDVVRSVAITRRPDGQLVIPHDAIVTVKGANGWYTEVNGNRNWLAT